MISSAWSRSVITAKRCAAAVSTSRRYGYSFSDSNSEAYNIGLCSFKNARRFRPYLPSGGALGGSLSLMFGIR